MSLTLTSLPDGSGNKALVAALYNGVSIKYVEIDGSASASAALKAKSVVGNAPILETPQGVLFESNAIARYIARIRRDTGIGGATFFESASIDSFIDWSASHVALAVGTWASLVLGQRPFNAAVQTEAVQSLKEGLAVLESHLISRTYLVGEAITLADIAVASDLHLAFVLVLDASFREAYPSVTRWFHTIANQPHFVTVFGETHFAEKQQTAAGGAAASGGGAAAHAAGGKGADKKAAVKAEKEKAPKAEKAEKPAAASNSAAAAPAVKLDDNGIPIEAKKANPFASLPKSTFDMDEWKRTYSNAKPDKYVAMPWFWEKLDTAGYSLWKCVYKFPEENTVNFKVCNSITGYQQRCEEIRKYLFGVHWAIGSKAPYPVEGVYFLRGAEIAPMLECNPDAEYYTWEKLDPASAEVRKLVEDYWCADTIRGEECLDSKVFK